MGYVPHAAWLAAGLTAVSIVTAATAAETVTNSLGMKLVRIEPGTFRMGSDEGDFDERPAHTVRITRPVRMATTEVTNAQYEQFDPNHRRLRGRGGFSKADGEAVVCVSWHDAAAFCRWLAEREGKPYRLPTEAEWEYACRAGTTGAYHTGKTLPKAYHRHQRDGWNHKPVELHVGRSPANPWGLCDMHGNVEEWCLDGYGPYEAGEQTDPVGRDGADFKVTRGGAHNMDVRYLRSANRSGTLAADRHWLIGFRVVQAPEPKGRPLPPPPPARWARDVRQARGDWPAPEGYDPDKPYFRGPTPFVHIPKGADGPLYARHNHQPAITACPNGDLLAIWYSCRRERTRELTVVASRLRRGAGAWEPADVFWNAPDRNDHGSDIWWDGKETLYHFNGLSTGYGWSRLALVMRTSTDNGATWSAARILGPEHGLRHQVIAGALRTSAGRIIVKCDARRGGNGGTAVHLSDDGGETWRDPGKGADEPRFVAEGKGRWIAGIHAALAEAADGRLVAFGRGDNIAGQMPRSESADGGQTWTYHASGLAPIGGGQRAQLLRLREGPMVLISFDKGQTIRDAAGRERKITGMYAAVSTDGGRTFPVRRPVTPGGRPRTVDGGGNTGRFRMTATDAEPRGYLAVTQTPDGIIHLITSKQHYRFNLAWLRTPLPTE